MAESEEDAISKVNGSKTPKRRYSDRGLDVIDVIDIVPNEHRKILI